MIIKIINRDIISSWLLWCRIGTIQLGLYLIFIMLTGQNTDDDDTSHQ